MSSRIIIPLEGSPYPVPLTEDWVLTLDQFAKIAGISVARLRRRIATNDKQTVTIGIRVHHLET